jgi:type III secretion protein D
MLELRILSGLHRGATLPLDDDSTLVMGADEAADVVLLDPGIEPQHATLRTTGEGWALSMLDGELLGADTNQPLESADLMPGEFARLGRVWVTVVESDRAWSEPPPEPLDMEYDDLDQEYEEEAQYEQEDIQQEGAHDDDMVPLHADQQPAVDENHAHAEAEADPQQAAPETKGKRRWGKPQLILGSLGILTVLGALGALQLSGGASDKLPFKNGVVAADAEHKSGTQAKQDIDPADTNKDRIVTQQELRDAFRKRLSEVDLLKRFDLNLKDNDWTMKAALDDDEAARFERTLAAFVAQHKIGFPIQAKVGNAEHMLPFKIRQVISGANASVVTLDGNRLYVGDEYQGVRLVSIQGSRLVFAGKRKIEVRW